MRASSPCAIRPTARCTSIARVCGSPARKTAFGSGVLLDEWEQYSAGERTHQSNLIIVRELIQAIEEDRPVRACSSGEDGRAALEMIMAVHESQRLGTRVSLPLANRDNPYETWRRGGWERG